MRIAKVNRYTKALYTTDRALSNKAAQLVSAMTIIILLMITASVLIYSIENEAQPDVFANVFANAFSGLWWIVATFTTVGYGDIYPVTI